MGMFDYIVCKAPLPGEPPAFIKPGHCFQTKDLDNCMDTYEISEDGRLLLVDSIFAKGAIKPEPIDYHGDIHFYDSNICASGPDGKGGHTFYTRDGSDAVHVNYRARFTEGKLTSIVETGRKQEPARPESERRF